VNQKASSLTSLTFVSSQIFVTLKVFEQDEILAVQYKITPLTNGVFQLPPQTPKTEI
jgi:hypothetical protein